jgi:FdrA protein
MKGFLERVMKSHLFIRHNTYRDSMVMMKFQSFVEKIPGVIHCAAVMATPTNKEHLNQLHLLTQDIADLSSNDLCIVVEADVNDASLLTIQEQINHFLDNPRMFDTRQQDELKPKSLKSALKILPAATIVQISVPGEYAAYETMNALDHGLNVFLFSDNVSTQDEVDMKASAEKKGLLVMGPDCGTAIISGVGLGFSNDVRRGNIGIIGASGTGVQEVSCIIHKMGEGVSHVIGTGGRDLLAPVSGKTFARAFDILACDTATDVIVCISKKFDVQAAESILHRAAQIRKPVVVYFPGISSRLVQSPNIHYAYHLEHAAISAVEVLHGKKQSRPLDKETVSQRRHALIQSECKKFSPTQHYIKALLTGGSFAEQAIAVLREFVNPLYAYLSDEQSLSDPLTSREHSVIDLGADFFTHGRVHPMINPQDRNDRIRAELQDDSVRVLLLDVVLGYGSHADPAGELSAVIGSGKLAFKKKGNYLSCVVFICGTENDIQNLAEQKRKLEDCGAIVTDSSTEAAYIAGLIGTGGRG